MFTALDPTTFEKRLALFDPRRDRDQCVRLLVRIDEFLTLFQQQGPVFIDGRSIASIATAAGTLARRLRTVRIDPYWLAEMTSRGVDQGKGTADRRKAARLIRRLQRDARLLSTALQASIELPQHKGSKQGQRTDPRTDELVMYLRSAWNRGTGYYPTVTEKSEFVRVVLAIARDPGWRAAGLPPLTYRQLRDRISAGIGRARWSRETLAQKTSATSRAKSAKSRKVIR
jgi:hypothetical protein